MSQKEPWNRAVKNHHFDMLVSFHRSDDLVELWNGVRAKDVKRRMIDRDSPIRRRSLCQFNLFRHNVGCLPQSVFARWRQSSDHFPKGLARQLSNWSWVAP